MSAALMSAALMSAAPASRADKRPLLVAVVSADPVRRRRLAGWVAAAGHAVAAEATDAEGADIVLLDGDGAVPGVHPVVALGGIGEHAGMLRAEATPEQIDAALRAVAVGLRVSMPAAATPRRFAPTGFAMVGETPAPLLTPREMQVLASVGAGLSNKAAARALGISQHTVKFHLEAIYGKLGAAGRAEAVAKGLRQGLLEV